MTVGSGSITTSNSSDAANAVLLRELQQVTGTAAGDLTLGNITVGTGGVPSPRR